MNSKYKVGGKITLSKDEEYRILDIKSFENNEYIFCVTSSKPIVPILFEYKNINGKDCVKQVKDTRLIEKISLEMLK